MYILQHLEIGINVFSVFLVFYTLPFLADLSEDENGSADPDVPYGLALPTPLKDRLTFIKHVTV